MATASCAESRSGALRISSHLFLLGSPVASSNTLYSAKCDSGPHSEVPLSIQGQLK